MCHNRQPQVLIVDDEEDWRDSIAFTLEMEGYNPIFSSDKREASQKIKNNSLDLICMNIVLRGEVKEGWQLEWTTLLSLAHNKNIKVVVITGMNNTVDENILYEKAKEYGVETVLFKTNIDRNKLIEQVKNKKNSPIKVFISYSTKDCSTAERLYDDLKKEGITPWLDKKNLIPGQNIKKTISQAIRESSYFLAIITENCVSTRGYFRKQQKIAFDLLDEIPLDEIFIIPAILADTKPNHDELKNKVIERFDERLRNLHWADLFDYEKGLEEILKTLKRDKQL